MYQYSIIRAGHVNYKKNQEDKSDLKSAIWTEGNLSSVISEQGWYSKGKGEGAALRFVTARKIANQVIDKEKLLGYTSSSD